MWWWWWWWVVVVVLVVVVLVVVGWHAALCTPSSQGCRQGSNSSMQQTTYRTRSGVVWLWSGLVAPRWCWVARAAAGTVEPGELGL